MGFWFFGPVTWRWGGGGGKKPRGSVTVFGAFITLPLAAWNLYRWQHPPLPPNPEFDAIDRGDAER